MVLPRPRPWAAVAALGLAIAGCRCLLRAQQGRPGHTPPPAAFAAPASRPPPAQAASQEPAEAAGAQRWQKGLDTAFLDVDASPEERLRGLQDALGSAGEVSNAFQAAARAVLEDGFQNGHPKALDLLFPRGTLARADLEGIAAVVRQAPEVANSISGSATHAEAPSLQKVREALSRFLAGGAEEAQNALRSTPKGWRELEYEVLHTEEDFEIRRYQSYDVVMRRLEAGAGGAWAVAEGFNSLAGYLAGDNEEEQVMSMTMPVEVESSAARPKVQTMCFALYEEDLQAGADFPRPVDPSVQVARVPTRIRAVRSFLGVATEGEAKRQADLLVQALGRSSTWGATSPEEYSVLQYNPPYTVPWRRRNEVAIAVAKRKWHPNSP